MDELVFVLLSGDGKYMLTFYLTIIRRERGDPSGVLACHVTRFW